jgi:tetratricopeptide (TPR) repeat protein
VRRIFTARGVAMACVAAMLIVIPVSAVRLAAQPQKEKAVELAKQKPKTDSEVTVTPDVEAIGDYFLAKLGKTGDKFAHAPKDGEDWYQRGYDFYHADRYPEAAAAFQKAAQMGYRADAALYNAACSYSLNDDHDNAMKYLALAIEAGWDDMDHIAEDSDLDPVRSDPRFAQVVKDARGTATNRRLTETMTRYQELQSSAIADGVAGAVAGGVAAGVKAGVEGGVKAGVQGGFSVHDGDITWNDKDNDGDDWFDVGLDLLRLRKLDESIHAFQQSIKANEKVANATYNIACAYSIKGDVASGMAWLEKAIDAGFSSDEKFENDPDIRNLRSNPRFAQLRAMANDLELKGCCDDDDDDDYGSWRAAAAHHREIVQKYPNVGRAWFNLGYTSLQAHDFQAGIDAFNHAISLGHRVDTSSYNIACAYALRGDKDSAFAWLDKARAAGFDLRSYLTHDEDLESLRDDPRYVKLKKEIKADSIRLFKNGKIDLDFDFDFHH